MLEVNLSPGHKQVLRLLIQTPQSTERLCGLLQGLPACHGLDVTQLLAELAEDGSLVQFSHGYGYFRTEAGLQKVKQLEQLEAWDAENAVDMAVFMCSRPHGSGAPGPMIFLGHIRGRFLILSSGARVHLDGAALVIENIKPGQVEVLNQRFGHGPILRDNFEIDPMPRS